MLKLENITSLNHFLIYDDNTPLSTITKGYSTYNSTNELTTKVVVSFAQLSKLTGTPLVSAESLDVAIKQLSKDLYAGFGNKVVVRVLINIADVDDADPYGFNPTLTPTILKASHYPKIDIAFDHCRLELAGETHYNFFHYVNQHPVISLIAGIKRCFPHVNVAVEGTTAMSFGASRGYDEETIKQLKEFNITLLPSRMNEISNIKFANLVRENDLAIINEESLSGFFFNSQETFEVDVKRFM